MSARVAIVCDFCKASELAPGSQNATQLRKALRKLEWARTRDLPAKLRAAVCTTLPCCVSQSSVSYLLGLDICGVCVQELWRKYGAAA